MNESVKIDIDLSKPEYYKTLQFADIDGDNINELIIRGENGITAWKYDKKHKKFQQISLKSTMFSDDNYWNEEKYYKTIKIGDIDNDGAGEIIGRSFYNIQTYKYSEKEEGFEKIAQGPRWSDKKGWAKDCCYDNIFLSDIDGDGADELIGKTTTKLEAYKFNCQSKQWEELAHIPPWVSNEKFNDRCYFKTIRLGDVDGDGAAEILVRNELGIEVYKYTGDSWMRLPNGPAWSDNEQWSYPYHYETIRLGDIDGDGADELIGRGKDGLEVYKYSTINKSWQKLSPGKLFSDEDGWRYYYYHRTITLGDIDGDEADEIVARGKDGIEVYKYTLQGFWQKLANGPSWSDQKGYQSSSYYEIIQLADIDNDGIKELVGKEKDNLVFYKYNPLQKTWTNILN